MTSTSLSSSHPIVNVRQDQKVQKTHPIVTSNKNNKIYRTSSKEASLLELGQVLELWLHLVPRSFPLPYFKIERSQDAVHQNQRELSQMEQNLTMF